MFNKRVKVKELLATEATGQEVIVMGWVRGFRNNQFIALNDGSTNANLQVVAELGMLDEDTMKRITQSASLKVTGTLIPSMGKGQKVEVKAAKIEILGDSDAEKYPLQLKNKPSLEYLREIAHLRFRTNTFGAVFRIRHTLAFAIHKFFHEKGFVYMHTPIVTASDAEGAGEMFRVTTLDLVNLPFKSKKFEQIAELYFERLMKHIESHGLKDFVSLLENRIKEVYKDFGFRSIVLGEMPFLEQLIKEKKLASISKDFENLFETLADTKFFEREVIVDNSKPKPKAVKIRLPNWLIEEVNPVRKGISATYRRYYSGYLSLSFYNFTYIINHLRNTKDREVIFKEDFFGRGTNLTVSGQLEGELAATAFSEIYTFGPTFRAENSNTPRHLAEFWMIEPEMAFYDLEDNMNLAEEFIRYIIRFAMDNNREDLEFLAQRLADEEKQLPQDKRGEMGLIEKLEFVLNNNFERITYTEAIDILLSSPAYKKKKFQFEVKWGIDMQSEHERYLVEKHFKKPVIVTGYPGVIKSFYMRQNDDGKTVAAMDILAPGIGEIVGGSQREERLEKLVQRMKEMHVPVEEMWWYLDTRRYGTVPHAGFGLGFERMVQFVTGMTNIRDVIAFPRTPKSAEF